MPRVFYNKRRNTLKHSEKYVDLVLFSKFKEMLFKVGTDKSIFSGIGVKFAVLEVLENKRKAWVSHICERMRTIPKKNRVY